MCYSTLIVESMSHRQVEKFSLFQEPKKTSTLFIFRIFFIRWSFNLNCDPLAVNSMYVWKKFRLCWVFPPFVSNNNIQVTYQSYFLYYFLINSRWCFLVYVISITTTTSSSSTCDIRRINYFHFISWILRPFFSFLLLMIS